MPPRSFTSCNSLPPEGARFSLGRPGGKTWCPPLSRISRRGGFTLIELLVAISIMALMAVLSWRGLDGMVRAQAQTSVRADQVLTLQAGLAQFKFDLDAMVQTPQTSRLSWDGQVLRITRQAPGSVGSGANGIQVVAWARRAEGAGQWLRWQSPVVLTQQAWGEAWAQATRWSQNASEQDRLREVSITPLQDWQVFYFRGNAWSNPLSSDDSPAAQAAPPPSVPATSTGTGTTTAAPVGNILIPSLGITGVVGGALGGVPGAQAGPPMIPDGVRLVLTLPAGQAINGKLVVDWVRPNFGGNLN